MTFAAFVRQRISPVQYLVFTTVGQTGVGFVKGLIIARVLGPGFLGVTAILDSLNGVVVNLVDIRLTDLASKLYYDVDPTFTAEQLNAYHISVLLTSILFNAVLAMVMMIISIIITVLTIHIFTATPVTLWWIVAFALAQSLSTISSTVVFLQRFIGHFYLFGTMRIVAQIIEMILFVTLVVGIGGLDGYFAALVTSAVFTLLAMLGVTLYTWTRRAHLSLAGFDARPILIRFWQHRRFLFYGNLLGYTKLLHRSADVLIVGYFTNDTVTGIYKFARALTDSLYILYDALYQVYQPTFLQYLAEHRLGKFWQVVRDFMIKGAVGTPVLIVLELLLLRPFLELVFGAAYIAAAPSMIVLSAAFGFSTTIILWTLPALIHSGKLGSYTLMSFVACAGQHVAMLILFSQFGTDPVFAAIGYCVYYAILLPSMVVLTLRRLGLNRVQEVPV